MESLRLKTRTKQLQSQRTFLETFEVNEANLEDVDRQVFSKLVRHSENYLNQQSLNSLEETKGSFQKKVFSSIGLESHDQFAMLKSST